MQLSCFTSLQQGLDHAFCHLDQSMHFLGFWMLLFLLLGHQIDGVNRVFDSLMDDNVRKVDLDRDIHWIHSYYPSLLSEVDGANAQQSSLIREYRSLSNDFMTLCSPLDSCTGRCGSEPTGSLYTCNCDRLCHQFSDCCIDYEENCAKDQRLGNTGVQPTVLPRLSCTILYNKFNVLSVSRCSASHSGVDKQLCSMKTLKECVFRDAHNESDAGSVVGNCQDAVYKLCMTKLELKCNEIVEPRCQSLFANHCKKYSASLCRRCHTRFWPVVDSAGVIYRNSYCAVCNSQSNFTLLTPYILSQAFKEMNSYAEAVESPIVRRCAVDAVESCSMQDDGSNLGSLCSNYSGAVMTIDRKHKVYKNVYCALCNGEELKNLTCAPKAYVMRGFIKAVWENFVTGDVNGMRFDDIPAAFSILLNFGLDGRQRMYFSSDSEEDMRRYHDRCGEGKIWDPFSQMCRKLYCSTEFVLVDYRCVRKDSDVPKSDEIQKETSLVPDARAEFVHLSLSAEMEILDFLQFNGQDMETISETLKESLASSFNIHIDRIRNVTFNISLGNFGGVSETLEFIEEMDDTHPIHFMVDFDLYEANETETQALEPSVDSIVSMLASALSMNGFEFDINNVTSRILEIHQSVSPLAGWCTAEGQVKKVYWNSEFTFILDGEYSSINTSAIKGIYVNKTDKFYPKEKIVADILFQGYQFSGNLINVSGMAIVCESVTKPKLNESCIRILIGKHEYALENSSLFVHNESLKNVVDDSAYEEAHNGSIWVCIKSLRTDPNSKIYMRMNVTEAYVSYILLWVSVISLSVVLLTYVSFPVLRNLPGCNTMNLTLSLLAMQLTFIFGQRPGVKGTACMVVGHLLHYEILCCFTWMNVIAFDLFRTFGDRKAMSSIRCKSKYLPRYMAYAYLSPVLIVTASSLVDIFRYESRFAPHYGGHDICWIVSRDSAIVFFATPLALVMHVNFVFFILTILAMKRVKNVSELSDLKCECRGHNDVVLYAKMAFVVGFTWTLSFAAAFVEENALIGKILTYIYIVFNTLQGVYICWAFVFNQRVYQLYKEALTRIRIKIFRRKGFEGSSQTIRRLANVMKRTVSSDTVISTISGVSTVSSDSRLSTVKENGDEK